MLHVALNWDSHRIRLAVASVGKPVGRLRFDQAVTVLLSDAGEPDAGPREWSTPRLADKLSAILERYGVSRGEATVVLARSDVEMRELQLPLVPAEELPDLVRFQVRNHFTSFTDDWLLDFVPISRSDRGCTVLAMAVSGDQAGKIRETVELAGLRLRHLVLRPFAAAELLRSHQPSSNCRVVLEPLWRQADISVVRDDYVVLTRTVRVPDTYSDEQFDAWLPDEISRTIAAASNQTGAETVDEIVVCGSESLHRRLREELSEKFQIPATFYDPFDAVSTGSEFEKPERIDGFASLLGSLIQSTASENHAVDFLNPRRPPQPELDKRKLAIGGGIAAAVLLIGVVWFWWVLSSRDAEIARLQQDNRQLLEQVEQVEEIANRVSLIDRWRQGGINWLEEMYQISLRYPGPDFARLNQVSASVLLREGVINIKGLIKDQQTLADLNQALLERPYNDVKIPRNTAVDNPDFGVALDQSIFVPLVDLNTIGQTPLTDDAADAGSPTASTPGDPPGNNLPAPEPVTDAG